MGMVVTVDGPAASGKTSISRELAKKLDWKWLSTGAFYRGLAYVALELDLELGDEAGLALLAKDPCWRVVPSAVATKVFFRDRDVTDAIHHEDVGLFASRVSALPKVRAALLEAQRDFGRRDFGLVAEGRDCGSVVFPDAIAKIYLTASNESRAHRRAAEHGLDSADTLSMQKQRDAQDKQRKVAPLVVPEGALLLDSTDLTLEETVEKCLSFVLKTGKI